MIKNKMNKKAKSLVKFFFWALVIVGVYYLGTRMGWWNAII